MFVKFQGSKDGSGAKRSKLKTPVNELDMKNGYIFHGMFAFILFGPQGRSKLRLSCLSKDGDGVVRQSRKETRKIVASEKKKERESGVGGYIPSVYNRGVPIREKAISAHMVLSSHQQKCKSISTLLVCANLDHANLLKEHAEAKESLKESLELAEGNKDDEDVVMSRAWKSRVLKRLVAVSNRKEQLEEESDNLRKHSDADRPVAAFLRQVGDFNDFTPSRKRKTTMESPTTAPIDIVNKNGSSVSLMTEEDDDLYSIPKSNVDLYSTPKSTPKSNVPSTEPHEEDEENTRSQVDYSHESSFDTDSFMQL